MTSFRKIRAASNVDDCWRYVTSTAIYRDTWSCQSYALSVQWSAQQESTGRTCGQSRGKRDLSSVYSILHAGVLNETD